MKRLPGPAPARTTADFPGGHAGASLKRQPDPPRNTRRQPDFPGGHAGASLKRRRLDEAGNARRLISPADTPGPH